VNYNDLAKPEVRDRYPEVVKEIKTGELVLPAVYVDDKVVSAGHVDYFTIARAVEQARSSANGKG
jgi:disulfide oxidoreductase YuzD